MTTETDTTENEASEVDPAAVEKQQAADATADKNDGDAPAADSASDQPASESTDGADAEPQDVEVNSLDYQPLSPGTGGTAPSADLHRFQDIKVTVSADLGRAKVPLQTLLSLGEGSVLELDRQIDSPVELVAQGVPLASGEVVVVNGCFAIRVTKVYEGQAG